MPPLTGDSSLLLTGWSGLQVINNSFSVKSFFRWGQTCGSYASVAGFFWHFHLEIDIYMAGVWNLHFVPLLSSYSHAYVVHTRPALHSLLPTHMPWEAPGRHPHTSGLVKSYCGKKKKKNLKVKNEGNETDNSCKFSHCKSWNIQTISCGWNNYI